MPTAAHFAYQKYFSGDIHCVVDKTTAELNAMGHPRIEDTLTNIMAWWWNLYTVELTYASTTSVSHPVSIGTASGFADQLGAAEAVPSDRACVSETGVGDFYFLGVAAVSDADSPIYGIGFQMIQVFYNTTTSKYALIVDLIVNSDSGQEWLTFQPGGLSVNGGTFTIFGTTWPSWKTPGAANLSASVSAPVYYTY